MKLSSLDPLNKKKNKQKITMLTGYDYPTAQLIDAAGIDVILVGDSVGTNVLGYTDVTQVTMSDMLHHVRAVARGTEHAFILADMPFGSFVNSQAAVDNAIHFAANGADGVKVEGEDAVIEQIRSIVQNNIPVCAHIGYTPQTRGIKATVQGKDLERARQLIQTALNLQKAGACMIVLELIPLQLAAEMTKLLTIPTIGIGAGPFCDGQVQVIYDIAGMSERVYKHAKVFGNVRIEFVKAISQYVKEVNDNVFPADANASSMDADVYRQLKNWIKDNL